jgi:uncharacterized C2H2 Zn-finger protein
MSSQEHNYTFIRCENCQKIYTDQNTLKRHQKRSKICKSIGKLKQPKNIQQECEKLGMVLIPVAYVPNYDEETKL